MEINGLKYDLRFTLGKIEAIEVATDMPVMVNVAKTNGIFGIRELKIYIAYGLVDGVTFDAIPQESAINIAEQLIQEKGYTEVCAWLYAALQRDCPFFFQAV